MNAPQENNEKLYRILEEAHNLKFNETEKAIELANFVYARAQEAEDDMLKANSFYTLGVCSEIISNYPQAMKYLSEAIKIAQATGDKRLLGDALNCAGVINDNLNNYSNALKAYLTSLSIYEELRENKKAGIVLSNIGLIYINIKDYKNALKFYSRSLDIAEEENDKESLLVANINIGLTHNLLGNYEESLRFLNDALHLAEAGNDKLRTSLALDHIAETQIELKNAGEAYRLFEESKKIKLELGDNKGLVKIYGIVGRLYLREGNIENAKLNLHKGLDIAVRLGMKKSVYELHKLLSEAHEKINDFKNALFHFKNASETEIEYLEQEAEAKARNTATQLEIEQAQKETEIQKLKNIELSKALEEVKQLNVNLKELNDEKSEFMAIAVHDLKNPLQNILSTARVLKRRDNPSEEELEEFTANIISQTSRMFNLIKKLLDNNAIEQGEINIKNSMFNANDICSELINNFKDEAVKKGLNIMYKEPNEEISVNTDREILYEILQNLLSNAIKFSPQDKTIFPGVSLQNDRVRFEITDEGPGFTEKDKEKIFTKFARLSAKPTGDEHSTGLGLSIVKRLCELIGAEISLQTEEGKGAKFTVSLQVKR